MSAPIELKPENGGLPVKFFLSEDMLPDGETVAQLENLAATPGLGHHVAVLPDVHRKGRNISPTGTAVVSRGALVPRAIDTGINCGMRMIRTDIDASAFTHPVLDQLFGTLMQKIPVNIHEEKTLQEADVHEILVKGGAWSQRRFGLSDFEMSCIEDGGTVPTDGATAEEIMSVIPRKSLKKGRVSLGTLGDGNHFLELQEIVEILDTGAASKLGLKPGQAVFMLHTGSRGVGSKMMKGFLKEREEELSAGQNGGLWTLDANSEEGVKYARAVTAVSNFGFANRIAITEQLRSAVRQSLSDGTLQLPLLYDCAHVSIKREKWNGEDVWVHRHGASSARPASACADHPVFSITGQPLPIPGSMGHDSFIGVADEGSAASFYSVNHGAGRVMDKPEASTNFSEAQIEAEMRAKQIRLYRYGSDNIAEQAPGSFKDITKVIDAMHTQRLARPVARVRPIAVLKG